MMDVVRPHVDGAAFLTEPRCRGLISVPVLVLSDATDVDVQACTLEVAGALAKPSI